MFTPEISNRVVFVNGKHSLCSNPCPLTEKLHCLDIIQINEAFEATKFQPLTKHSMEQQRSADGEQGGLYDYF